MRTTIHSLAKQFEARDAQFRHSTLVEHRGAIIAFAIDDRRRIHYAVLGLAEGGDERGPLDVEYWPDSPALLPFPRELMAAGFGAIDPQPMPAVRQLTRDEVTPTIAVTASDLDPFLSTTARLTADAPFQVLSDGEHVFVFRQAIAADHPDAVYALNRGGTSGDTTRDAAEFVSDSVGAKVPVAAQTLLVDRFVLAGNALLPNREVRYRRSRNRYRPAGGADTVGAADMSGQPFFEPTSELDFISELQNGEFTVALLPTSVATEMRWQFFVGRRDTGVVESISVARGSDGLFDTRGRQAYISPSPKIGAAALSFEPGTCPHTGHPLVPVESVERHAATALLFSGSERAVVDNAGLDLTGGFTAEFWLRCDDLSRSGVVFSATGEAGAPFIHIEVGGSPSRILFAFGSGAAADPPTGRTFPLDASAWQGKWVHLAVGRGNRIGNLPVILINGEYAQFGSIRAPISGPQSASGIVVGPPAASQPRPPLRPSSNVILPPNRTPVRLDTSTWKIAKFVLGGGASGPGGFVGAIDEFRLWTSAQTGADLSGRMFTALTGREPHLHTYWRFDEGRGSRVFDQTAGKHHGELTGAPAWVASDAPMSRGPGLSIDKFRIEDHLPIGGLSATLYYTPEKEEAPEALPVKTTGRVMLAVHARPNSGVAGDERAAVIDFAVSQTGRLSRAGAVLGLPKITAGDTKDIDTLVDMQRKERELTRRVESAGLDSWQRRAISVSTPMVVGLGGGEVPTGAVAAWDDLALIGDPRSGAVHVLERVDGTWKPGGTLPAPTLPQAGFGEALALFGTSAVVAVPSAGLYLFQRQSDATWKSLAFISDIPKFDRAPNLALNKIGGTWQIAVGTEKATYLIAYDNQSKSHTWGQIPLQGNYVPGYNLTVAIPSGFVAVGQPTHNRVEIYRWPKSLFSNSAIPVHGVLALPNGTRVPMDKPCFGASMVPSNHLLFVGEPGFSDPALRNMAHSPSIAMQMLRNRGAVHIYRQGSYNRFEFVKTIQGPTRNVRFGERILTLPRTNTILVGAPLASKGGRIYECETDPTEHYVVVRHRDLEMVTPEVEFATRMAAAPGALVVLRQPRTQDKVDVAVLGPNPEPQRELDKVKAWLATHANRSAAGQSGKMGWLATDSHGLTTVGAILDWAKPASPPTVVSSATGTIGLYYSDNQRQLLGAHYHALSARARFAVEAGPGELAFRALESGEHMNELTIEVTPGAQADWCNVTLRLAGRGWVESWRDVPRRASKLAAILNGQTPLPAESGSSHSDTAMSLRSGSTLVITVADPTSTDVVNGPATRVSAGAHGEWRADAPGMALEFDGSKTYASLGKERVAAVPSPDELTIEAWVRPHLSSHEQRLLHFRHQDRGFSLGLVPAASPSGWKLGGAMAFDCAAVVPSTGDFTLEAWTKDEFGISLVAPSGKHLWHLGGQDQLSLGDEANWSLAVATAGSTHGNWRHWALIVGNGGDSITLAVDGVANAVSLPRKWSLPEGTRLLVGQSSSDESYLSSGAVFDVRLWGKARSAEEVVRDKDRRLTGAEPGLLAYYTFEGGQAVDHSRFRRHAVQRLRTSGSYQEYAGPTAGPTVIGLSAVLFGVKHPVGGTKWALGSGPVYSGGWTHIAASFTQSYALRFDGRAFVDLGADRALDQGGELTLEITARLEQLGREQTLLAKGTPGAGDGQTLPYWLAVAPDGHLLFRFESIADDNRTRLHTLRSETALSVGRVHRIAVSRERGQSIEEERGKRTFTYRDQSGKQQTANVDTIRSVNPEQWTEIRFFIDGVERGRHRYDGPEPAHQERPLTLGCIGHNQSPLTATVSEVRVWSRPLPPAQLSGHTVPTTEGLVGYWDLEDKLGPAARDRVGESHGRIHGAEWVVNPDPRARAFSLHLNGEATEMPALGDSDPRLAADWGPDQLTIGGQTTSSGLDRVYSGVLEEVRMWRGRRTQEEILDNLFRRVDDNPAALLGYYPFDAESTRLDASHLRDHSGYGRDLSLPSDVSRPKPVFSTVPISADAPQIKSPLSGIQSSFRAGGDGRVSMQEYGDLQQGVGQTMSGVLKRCYGYTDAGVWHLVTGFKIGDLITEWVGQAQFAPQVMGYIEGVPPVPGENLTAGQITEAAFGWAAVEKLSSVELVESGTVHYALGKASESNLTGAFDVEAKTGLGGTEILLTLAPLGIGVTKKMVEGGLEIGLKGHVEAGTAWNNESSFGTTESRSQSLSLALGATWEPEDRISNPNLGRRLVPGNMGFAVVQSGTADLYALRMAKSRALVAYRMLPNPDLPRDWNLIPFPINPLYTKQGCLDGKIGFRGDGSVFTDEAYPQATARGAELSYYKPREAYALERRIRREEQRLRAFFEHRDTDYSQLAQKMTGSALKILAAGAATAMTANPITAPAAAGAAAGGGAAIKGAVDVFDRYMSRTNLPEKYAKRNLVNTYVWTADGGFFAETEEKTDVRSETVSGSFHVSGNLGMSLGFEFKVFGLGIDTNLAASMGGGYKMTRSRTKDTERSFSLAVSVDPPGDLQRYEKKGGAYVADGNAQPGRVDAYRFKSFYLDADSANFDVLFSQVIDPTWLESDAPNAVALRQANQGDRRPPCWRVFHRVTFVSRILEPIGKPTDEGALDTGLAAANIPSNWQLIQRLNPYVRSVASDPGRLYNETRLALESHLPELLPHLDDVVGVLRSYYGTPSG